MIEDFAKDCLQRPLRWTREALVWKLDGRTGVAAEYEEQIDAAAREAYRARVERAAQEAAGGSSHTEPADGHGAVRTAS